MLFDRIGIFAAARKIRFRLEQHEIFVISSEDLILLEVDGMQPTAMRIQSRARGSLQ
jgi:hypothetical protein